MIHKDTYSYTAFASKSLQKVTNICFSLKGGPITN